MPNWSDLRTHKGRSFGLDPIWSVASGEQEVGAMPIVKLVAGAGIASPEDLALLQRVFDEACRRNSCARDDQEGSTLAADLIAHFMSGKRDEAALLETVAPVRDRR